MSELQVLTAVAVVVVVVTLGTAIYLAVRLFKARSALTNAGVPMTKKWLFWGALAYLVLPFDVLPDPIYIDDIGVLLMALRSLHSAEEALPKTEKIIP
ncbi:YkvA family protein [Streptomyces sp. NPDC093085]|uniref:YkvA family protein n=1 Tax=Streptomyces sp. NPDC093085 TaxID=3155068 RepID=UPI00342EFBB5